MGLIESRLEAAFDQMEPVGAHVLNLELSGDRPWKALKLATAAVYTFSVFGDMLRKVMSSSMRCRSGEIGLFID